MFGINESEDGSKKKESTETDNISSITDTTATATATAITTTNQSYPFTKLSKFVYSILSSKLGGVKNENCNIDDVKCHLDFKSKYFEIFYQECNNNNNNNEDTSINIDTTQNFKQKKFSKLVNLFQTCENYYSIMMLNGNSNSDFELVSETSLKNNNNNEFYKCGLCFHYLNDPVTLVCGCTFCKMCLDEYNQSQFQIAVLKQYSDPSKHLYKCRNCAFSHNHNSSQNLNTNVFISKIIEKSFSAQVDARVLRNDIRKCVYLKKIDYGKAISLLDRVLSIGKYTRLTTTTKKLNFYLFQMKIII
jgi:hypothetical protein